MVKFSVLLNRRVFVMHGLILAFLLRIYEQAHGKTYDKTCVTSKDSDQPVRPPSLASVLVYPSLASLEVVEDTCDQRRLWSDCADAQADLIIRWSHKSYYRFCRALAQLLWRPFFFFFVSILLEIIAVTATDINQLSLIHRGVSKAF